MEPKIVNATKEKTPLGWKIVLVISILLGFVAMFGIGFFFSRIQFSESSPVPLASSVTPAVSETQSQDTTKFLPGKHYFEETLIAIAKDAPHLVVAATATRLEQANGYTQNARLSFFDGSNWTRTSDSKKTADSAIVSSSIIKRWVVDIDPSRVLKQSVSGKMMSKGVTINFSSGELQNEIGMRSLPGYTKFMSQASGALSVNGQEHDAYILYTRIYSANAADIQFYNDPFGLTTDWVIFWDQKGNFYHIDDTAVDKPTPIYQTHTIAVWEDVAHTVAKTFDLSVKRDTNTPPEKYTFVLGYPISVTLDVTRINAVNKAPTNSYSWYMGSIEGVVTNQAGETSTGIGLIEYIHH